MTYYIILFIIILVIILDNIPDNYKITKMGKYFFVGISITIFAIAILRDGVGFDYHNYERLFKYTKDPNISMWSLNSEVGYIFLNYISNSYRMVIILSACIAIPLKLITIYKYSDNKLISLLLYYSGFFIMYDMGVIRQGISVAFGFISIHYILNKSFKKFFLTIIIGSLFHITVLSFLPLYFLSHKKINRKTFYIIIPILIILSLFIDPSQIMLKLNTFNPIEIFSNKVIYYIETNTGEKLTLSLIKRILFLVLFIESYNYYKIDDKKSLVFFNGYFLSVVFMALFSSIPILGGRGIMGLYSLQIFIFPAIFEKVKTIIPKIAIMIVIIMISINSIKGVIDQGYISEQPYVPYKTIFHK